VYCHDHEHEKRINAGFRDGGPAADEQVSPSIFKPFEELDGLLKTNTGNADGGKESGGRAR
jgi:hypothetical protein